MMYKEVINQRWGTLTLFPESIPHFMHWDLMYLWMLERCYSREIQADAIPYNWQWKITAWRHLLSLFLIGKLERKEIDIRKPFEDFIDPYGLNSITWLKFEGSVLGILSPILIVRPLPDLTEKDISEKWPPDPYKQDDAMHDIVRYMASLARKSLQQVGGRVPEKLASILEHAFELSSEELSGLAVLEESISIPILQNVGWVTVNNKYKNVDILIFQGKSKSQTFIPRCSHCNRPLLQARTDEFIVVTTPYVNLKCEEHGSQRIDLKDLFIWYREKPDPKQGDVVLWKPDSRILFDYPSDFKGYPPPFTIKGVDIIFEWSRAILQGETTKRFLKLRFPERTVKEIDPEELLFDHILLPGDPSYLSSQHPLPVRLEWSDALEAPDEVTNQIEHIGDSSHIKVTFDNLRIKGHPGFGKYHYIGSLMVSHVPELAVGIFPHPGCVDKKKWKWFRIFAHMNETSQDDSTLDKYKISTLMGNNLLPIISEHTDGLPSFCTLLNKLNSTAGITFYIKPPDRVTEETSRPIKIGIDFGTSNTLIYSLYLKRDDQLVNVTSKTHAFEPRRVHEAVYWLAYNNDVTASHTLGYFLPGPTYLAEISDDDDQYLIPSELWHWCSSDDGSDDGSYHFIIRWSSRKPTSDAKAETNFKLSSESDRLRYAFLRELLLIYMGYLASSINFKYPPILGFAYPLAMGNDLRKKYSKLWKDVKREVEILTGISNIFLHSINESMACVKGIGEFNPGDAFLVADMGGGTLDIALMKNDRIVQIGSVRYAGEVYIEAAANKTDIDPWKIRDSIRFSQRPELRPTIDQLKTHHEIFDRFMITSFEFIRTLIASFFETVNDAKQTLKFIPAGNGWHLVNKVFGEEKDPRRVFLKKYQDNFISDIIDKSDFNVELHIGDILDKLQSAKHLLVRGILANDKNEIDNSSKDIIRYRLPAGRRIKLKKENNLDLQVEWWQLVGEGEGVVEVSPHKFHECQINFDLHTWPEPLPDRWKEKLLHVFGVSCLKDIPYPREEELRREFRINFIDGQFMLSPIHFIIESEWKNYVINTKMHR